MSEILRRGRLEALPDEEIINFTSSMSADRFIFDADVLIDLAHTIMLEEQGVISREDCVRILEGLMLIRDQGIMALDHSYEDIHISLESKLIDLTGEDVGGRMHSGRSRNDEVATCIRLTLRNELLCLMEELLALLHTLHELSSENMDTLMPGFTHLQHAQPTTLAHHLMAHFGALGRDLERVRDCFKRVNLSPLGSAAFASTGFNINRERTCNFLGFDGLVENSMDAVSSRDFLIETASVTTNIMINLSRIAEELVVWSTTEFSFIELDDRYASTSSIMPQKKNPDTAELLRGKTGMAVGSLMSLITICKGLPLSYNRDLQEATPNIWNSMSTTRSSVRIIQGMLKTMTVNKDAMFSRSIEGFTTATELADTLVRVCGIPFRTAHQIVGVLARGDDTPTLGLIDAVSHDVIGEGLSRRGLTEEMVTQALDPFQNVAKRTVTGGPSPSQMRQMLERTGVSLEEAERLCDEQKNRVEDCIEKLFRAIEGYGIKD